MNPMLLILLAVMALAPYLHFKFDLLYKAISIVRLPINGISLVDGRWIQKLFLQVSLYFAADISLA